MHMQSNATNISTLAVACDAVHVCKQPVQSVDTVITHKTVSEALCSTAGDAVTLREVFVPEKPQLKFADVTSEVQISESSCLQIRKG